MSPTVEAPSRVPSGVCQPGCTRLSAYLRDRYDLGDSGCYNPASRTQSGGPSFHVAGQAIDLTANWHNTTEAARGVAAMQWAIDHADELNLQEAIFGHRIITSRRWPQGVRFYAPTDHENHLHIAVGQAAAKNWKASSSPATTPVPPSVVEAIPTRGNEVDCVKFQGHWHTFWIDKGNVLRQHIDIWPASKPLSGIAGSPAPTESFIASRGVTAVVDGDVLRVNAIAADGALIQFTQLGPSALVAKRIDN